MGKRLLMTLLILTCISILTGKRIYDERLPSLADIGFEEPVVRPDAELQPLFNEFERFVQDRMEKEGIPGAAIAIVKDTSVVYLNTFGLKERHSYDSIDVHTAFRLASVSKGFAPVLAGMLVEEGLIDFDDRVIEYVPDFKLKTKTATENLTIRHVLSHTTGLPRHTYSNLLDDGVPYKKILARLQKVYLSHQVGTHYNYQNVAYSLIGDVVEKATGKSYDQLLEERIFQPLKMKDASATYEELINMGNVAIPHMRSRSGYRPIKISPNYYDVCPAAGVNASIADVVSWMELLLGHRQNLISEDMLREVFTPFVRIPSNDKVLSNWRSLLDQAHYAMGWRVIDCDSGDQLVYHGGYVNGFRSEVAMVREDGLGIAVLTNAPSYFISDALPTFFELYFEFKKRQSQNEIPLLSGKKSAETKVIPMGR